MQLITEKSPEIKEYLAFKGKINTHAFLEAVNSIPSIRAIPHSGQLKIIEAYEERIAPSEEALQVGLDFQYKYRFLTVAAGRRFGKSVICSLIGAMELLIPNSKVMIYSYRLDNCETIFNHIRKIIKGLGIDIVMDRVKDQELLLCNGATLRVASNDNVEAKLGSAVSLLIVDEAKLAAKKLFEQTLLPMTLDYFPLSRSILISSPETGWFENYYNYGQSTDPRYSTYWSINLPSSTNPTLPAGYLEAMKETTPPDVYAQEYLGLFTSAAGLVCQEFRDDNIFDPAEEPHYYNWLQHSQIVNTIDSGYSHYFASLHFMFVEETDTYYVFNEYQMNKKVTSVHADAIKEYEEENQLEVSLRYADPAASQQIADLVEHDLYYNKSEKNLRETISTLNSLMFQTSAVTGKPRFRISKNCPEIIRQIKTLQWKEGDDQQTKEKSATGTKPFAPDKDKQTDWDMFDALRYGVFTFHKNHSNSISVFSYETEDDEELDPYQKMMMEQGYMKLG